MNKMKLIMESWKRYLKEERETIDPRLLPALAQDAMGVVATNPGVDVGSITLATMAQAGCELPLIDMESVAEITLGDLFDEAALQDIMLGRAHSDNSEPEGALEERGQGVGMPPTTPPEDEFPSEPYPERKLPKSSTEEGKVKGHQSRLTHSKEKRGKSKKPEKKAYNKADRAQAKRELKK